MPGPADVRQDTCMIAMLELVKAEPIVVSAVLRDGCFAKLLSSILCNPGFPEASVVECFLSWGQHHVELELEEIW